MHDYLRVAVSLRLRNLFEYRCAPFLTVDVGSRVSIPFGRQSKIGLVVDRVPTSSMPEDKIRDINNVLDEEPVVSSELMSTLKWVSEYYHQSFGEILWTALPMPIRRGQPQQPKLDIGYALTEEGRKLTEESFSRARVQKKIFQELLNSASPVTKERLERSGKTWRNAIQSMETKGWVVTSTVSRIAKRKKPNLIYELTFDQQQALSNITDSLNRYQCFLLQGVTGSGKTEVYLRAALEVINKGRQVLLLVPEIGLMPQTVERLSDALGVQVFSYHSGMSSVARHRTWWFAKSGQAKVIAGTRSAALLSFQDLGLIVIDEEHDSSFKQQERARYHARTVALYRAMKCNIPIVLGSATPSLETICAASNNRLTTMTLPHRATRVAMPTVRVLDLNEVYLKEGVAMPLINAIQKRIDGREQSLIFLNRRGFAPVVVCGDCKWVAKCDNCDVKMILHKADNRLHCHLCGIKRPVCEICEECGSERMHNLGEGTERIESVLHETFPGARIMRIDSDATKGFRDIEKKLTRIQKGEADILVGTQMLSKGHHFPFVTLVGILNADQGFFSIDFRAMEYVFQQVLQVAGRAGRVEKPGEVIIQTLNPDSEYFERIRSHDYMGFAKDELAHRKQANQPPYAHYALLRANSLKQESVIEFLNDAKRIGEGLLLGRAYPNVDLMDVVMSPISRIAKRARAQLLATSTRNDEIKPFLSSWVEILEKHPRKGGLRWNLDVDPIDFH